MKHKFKDNGLVFVVELIGTTWLHQLQPSEKYMH